MQEKSKPFIFYKKTGAAIMEIVAPPSVAPAPLKEYLGKELCESSNLSILQLATNYNSNGKKSDYDKNKKKHRMP